MEKMSKSELKACLCSQCGNHGWTRCPRSVAEEASINRADGWVSAKTPPKKNGIYIIDIGLEYAIPSYFDTKYGWNTGVLLNKEILHWQPLPQPPGEEE